MSAYGYYGAGTWVRCDCATSFHIGPKERDGKTCAKCGKVHRVEDGKHVVGLPDAITEDEAERFSDLLHWDHILPEDF